MPRVTPEEIDAILPQTQCGLCGHGGCMPYAEALVFAGAAINLCPPGGIKVLHKLGQLLQQDPAPHEADMQTKTKARLLAKVREHECIGCTKCIQVCPVDAILGSSKNMHSVISDECTGCELCVPACPVDCIDMVALDKPIETTEANQFRQRFQAREQRLAQEAQRKQARKQLDSVNERKNYIQAALQRAQAKKSG